MLACTNERYVNTYYIVLPEPKLSLLCGSPPSLFLSVLSSDDDMDMEEDGLLARNLGIRAFFAHAVLINQCKVEGCRCDHESRLHFVHALLHEIDGCVVDG